MRDKMIRNTLIAGAAGALMLPAAALAAGDNYSRADMDRDYQAWKTEQMERLDREYETWSSERWDSGTDKGSYTDPTQRETPTQSGIGGTTGSPAGRVTGSGPTKN